MKIKFLVLTSIASALFLGLVAPISAQTGLSAEQAQNIAQSIQKRSQCAPVTWIEKATSIDDGLIVPCECLDSSVSTNCDLESVLQTIVNISQVLLALTGGAAVLMFTYGGVMFIVAAGNSDRVAQGKAALQAAVIGIIVILGAWLIVNFTIISLTGGNVVGNGPAEIFNRAWTAGPDATPPSGEQGSSSDAGFCCSYIRDGLKDCSTSQTTWETCTAGAPAGADVSFTNNGRCVNNECVEAPLPSL